VTTLTEKNEFALELFAPVAQTYDRYARLLSFGQDDRWRSFLVSRVEAAPDDRILDVACGTAAVALELVRRYGCSVAGVDQSSAMLAEGRRRVARAGEGARIDLHVARAEELPFDNDTFDGATFTYLLRYVDDPAATLRELARVVAPGGRIASLDVFVPARRAGALARGGDRARRRADAFARRRNRDLGRARRLTFRAPPSTRSPRAGGATTSPFSMRPTPPGISLSSRSAALLRPRSRSRGSSRR
jgi:ubiquinone/menaquinone biosynthesis methyltransferase